MTDLELATAFFERIRALGAAVEIKLDESGFTDILINSPEERGCFALQFYGDGSYKRISGYAANGYWQDEVDCVQL